MRADATPRAIMACMSDEAFWESFHYRPMREVDGVLADRMTEVFIDAFAAAALLRRADRDAIVGQLELEVGSNAERQYAIQVGFMFAGGQAASKWDGTPEEAWLIVEDIARGFVDSIDSDPQEEDDWQAIFERRS